MTPPVKRPTGHHHGDLRPALEEAALGLIAEQGAKGFALAEVCRRAGVSVAAPYKHFADRDELLAVIARRGYEEQRRRYLEAMKSNLGPVAQMAAFADAYVQFAVEERALFETMFAAGLDKARYPELAAAGAALFAVLDEPARQLRGNVAAARALILDVTAAAHGWATFLLEGVLADEGDPLAFARRRASLAAKVLAADGMKRRSADTGRAGITPSAIAHSPARRSGKPPLADP